MGTVGLESAVTRYGTSYETVYQLLLLPRVALRLEAFELSATLPFGTSATAPTYCCRAALGNATVAAAHHGGLDRVRHWAEVSVSAPTSRFGNAHASSLAATAALMLDAGYYLPDTTTLRAQLGGEVDVTGWLWLGASVGADYWLRHGEPTNALVVPLDVSARLPWAPDWSARVVFHTLARAADAPGPSERFSSQLSGAIEHEWLGSRVGVSLSVPLDESLRQLEMLSANVAYARSF